MNSYAALLLFITHSKRLLQAAHYGQPFAVIFKLPRVQKVLNEEIHGYLLNFLTLPSALPEALQPPPEPW